jgi:hypothetical protein
LAFDFFFVVFFLLDFLAVFGFFAAFILSTRVGYFRPAFLAAFLALFFFAGHSFVDFLPAFFFGLALSQGAFLGFLSHYVPSATPAATELRHVSSRHVRSCGERTVQMWA